MTTKTANQKPAPIKASAAPKKAAPPKQPTTATKLAPPAKPGQSMDFSKMPMAKLLEAEVSLKNELTRRKREAKKSLMKEMQTKAKAAGLSMNELMGTNRQKTEHRIKYRNPANPAQAWAGLGKRPDWLKAALAEGKTMQDLAVSS
jgi:DNA-binding protein H-NS